MQDDDRSLGYTASMGSLGFQGHGGQPGIVLQSGASFFVIREIFYGPAIPGAAGQPGRIGRCGGAAGRSAVRGRADSDGGQELHAGGYAFFSPDENPTHIEPKRCSGS